MSIQPTCHNARLTRVCSRRRLCSASSSLAADELAEAAEVLGAAVVAVLDSLRETLDFSQV